METPTSERPALGHEDRRSRVDRARLLANVRKTLFGKTFDEPKIGRYILRQRLASGAMGQVHLAFDPRLRREVALKVLRCASESETAAVAREARALARLDLVEVVRVFDVGQSEHGLFIAMERLQGATLEQWLRENDPSEANRIRALEHVARGLCGAHAAGVVHRDVKPKNVMVEPDGRVVLVDFGLAVELGHGPGTSDAPIVGTPAYMAPEQHRGEPASPAADQYAWCVMAWESLYGARPFLATTGEGLLSEKLRNALPRSAPSPRVPGAVHRVLLRGLAPSARARWPSMDALLFALERARSARRRLFLWGSMATLACAALVYSVASPSTTEASACVPPLEWDAARPSVQRAIEGNGEAWRRRRWQRLGDRLETIAGAHASVRASVCDAVRETEETQATRECLQRWTAGFSGLIEALESIEEAEVSSALRWSYSLKDPSACLTPAAASPGGPPAPSRLARDVLALRIRLERAGQLRSDGALGRAEEELRRLADDAEALGFDPVLAEVLCSRARVLSYTADPRSLPMFERAYAVALRSRHDYYQSVAANRIIEVLLLSQGDTEGARVWLSRAKAARPHRWPKQEVRRLQGEAILAIMTGNEEDGVAIQRRAQSLAETTGDPTHILSITERTASVFRAVGLLDEAYATAKKAVDGWEELDEATWGSLTTLGDVASEIGAYDEADHALARALERIEDVSGPDSPNAALVQLSRADAFNLRQQWDEASRAAEAAARGLRENPQHQLWTSLSVSLGRTRLGQGRFEEAIAAFDRAQISAEELWGSQNDVVGVALAGRGRAMLESGDSAGAREVLDEAWDFLSEGDEPGLDRDMAELRFAMARVAAQSRAPTRDPDAMARQALQMASAPDPASKAVHARIERWLSQRGH